MFFQPDGGAPSDVSELYRSIGLLAAPNPLAFVGKISSFASACPDTTLVLASISVPNRALTFTREGDRYRAPYEVKTRMSRGDVEVANVNAMEIVRVGSFREDKPNRRKRDLSALLPRSSGRLQSLGDGS